MFIDIHAHSTIYPRDLRPLSEKGIGNPDELVEIYDYAGIDMGVIMPATQPEPRACVQSNEDILRCAALYPDRLIPFCGIDPRLACNSPDTDFSYVINHYRDKGCRGIGEITANLWFDDPRCWNLFRHAESCGLPLTFQPCYFRTAGFSRCGDPRRTLFNEVHHHHGPLRPTRLAVPLRRQCGGPK